MSFKSVQRWNKQKLSWMWQIEEVHEIPGTYDEGPFSEAWFDDKGQAERCIKRYLAGLPKGG